MSKVYFVSQGNCTHDEPSEGWYVSTLHFADDLLEYLGFRDQAVGPYQSRSSAQEAAEKMVDTRVEISASDLVGKMMDDTTEWDTRCDEMHWSGGYDTKRMDAAADSFIADNCFKVTDEENLGNELFAAYEVTEKGLS
ncbi:MAG: hypothetical protein EON56_05670 [Alphaproteobacteria bacterium]|nr:MAG: hypothetical protein EON56_05670 [Alphaproteobacteria bacterium]